MTYVFNRPRHQHCHVVLSTNRRTSCYLHCFQFLRLVRRCGDSRFCGQPVLCPRAWKVHDDVSYLPFWSFLPGPAYFWLDCCCRWLAMGHWFHGTGRLCRPCGYLLPPLRVFLYARLLTTSGSKVAVLRMAGCQARILEGCKPFKIFIQTVELAIYPPILWSGFYTGVVSGSTVATSLVSAIILPLPPYNLGPAAVGPWQVSGFTGALIGFSLGGNLIDYIAAVFTRRSKGVWEPEKRPIALATPGLCGPSAMLIVGLCFRYQTTWITPAIGNSLLGLKITCVNKNCVTDAVKSYLTLSGEVITIVFVIRNTVSCLLAVYRHNWIKNVGVAQALGTIGATLLGFALSAILIFFYDKCMDLATAQYGVLKRLDQQSCGCT